MQCVCERERKNTQNPDTERILWSGETDRQTESERSQTVKAGRKQHSLILSLSQFKSLILIVKT